MKLSTRIALAVGVAVPLLVLGAGWLLLRLVAEDLHGQQDAHLRERAAAVGQDARRLLRATANDRPPAALQSRERRLYTSALDVGIRLVGPEGEASGGPQPDPSVALPAAAPAPVTLRAGDASWRVMSVEVTGARKSIAGTLWLFSPDTASEAQLGLVRRRVVTVALLAAPLSGLLAWAVASRAARPLRLLQRRTSGLDPRSSATRPVHAPSGVGEVDDLAETLRTVLARYDEQAARTEEALATARSFSAAASHELRTPLMSMQTNLEILADHPGLEAAERDEVLADLRREHARLLGLLVMLRELGRGDLVEAEAFGPLDLAEVLDASAGDLRRRHPGARIGVDAVPGVVVHGWEPGLRSVVDNLLTNALVHGRRDGRPAEVEAVLRTEIEQADASTPRAATPGGRIAVLTVDDHGPGIPPQTRGAVFERFRRRPDSPGSGLGLTLVAQQIALHRGLIRVLDPPSGPGTRIEVRLPLRDGPSAVEATLPLRRDWMIGTAALLQPGRPAEQPAARPAEMPAARPQGFHKDGS
ncbi:HAMP domain-containing sensor histidine kinase [Streptomyces sp. NPDC047108]|uniref:sensor histidine kinase n=1 Tax=Streptomyces sp. NPDC047108 TaxID=3155025 RepID=UPI0033DB9063